MKTRYKRLILVGGGLAALGVSAWLILSAFQKNLVFFFTPTQIFAGEAPHNHSFRIGGMVEKGSLVHQPDGLTWTFMVTDTARKIPVSYKGILPDLFKEGKGVVAEGKLGSDNIFAAEQVLAKHDENYMPPDAAYALKKGKEANEANRQIGATVVGAANNSAKGVK
ncbi:MAG: cytochrome c maturation protein CcmE [Burkholderiales bacterium]